MFSRSPRKDEATKERENQEKQAKKEAERQAKEAEKQAKLEEKMKRENEERLEQAKIKAKEEELERLQLKIVSFEPEGQINKNNLTREIKIVFNHVFFRFFKFRLSSELDKVSTTCHGRFNLNRIPWEPLGNFKMRKHLF